MMKLFVFILASASIAASTGPAMISMPRGQKSDIIRHAASTQAATPDGQVSCQIVVEYVPGKGGGTYLILHLSDASLVKNFDFDEFEGPDAPFGTRKLAKIQIQSSNGTQTIEAAGAGWYSSAKEFMFSVAVGRQPLSVRKRLIAVLSGNDAKLSFTVHGLKKPSQTISATTTDASLINGLRDALNGKPSANSKTTAKTQVSAEQITAAVRDQFGPKVETGESLLANYYLTGDFNGDGNPDLAVIVKPEKAKTELVRYHVEFVSIDPYSATNGQKIDPAAKMSSHSDACLGVAIIHGTANGWTAREPVGKFMFYECFSDFRLVRKGQPIRRGRASTGPTPMPKGDSLQLDLESGGTALVYWDGKTYRGFGQRGSS